MPTPPCKVCGARAVILPLASDKCRRCYADVQRFMHRGHHHPEEFGIQRVAVTGESYERPELFQ